MMSEVPFVVGDADAALAAAEAEIRRRGCDRVALNTHSFQAPGFYARFGYRECGRTPGYPHGHDDIHLLKLLG
jgi:GNAT superfamily N-acetyltransferase